MEVHCTFDPTTKGGWSDDGRKVRGTLHWVSAIDAIDAEVRLYEHLFLIENPDSEGKDFTESLNPESLVTIKNCKIEPALSNAEIGINYQFLRIGYFCMDKNSNPNNLIFNRTVGLRDSWAKQQK
jgi:glutaminyl-tRNA synthetase